MALTTVNPGMLDISAQYTGFKNRIINGDMRIDQRNAGANVSQSGGVSYTLDRWAARTTQASKYTVGRNAGAIVPPNGFTNYLGVTSSSAYSVVASDYFAIQQAVEGFNIADLGWGTTSAQPITLSFWVRSSLIGTFGGSFGNSVYNRSYAFTYTINSANTWEQKTITVPGETTGTWASDNNAGVFLYFGIGCGTTHSGTSGNWQTSGFMTATGAVSVVGTAGATFYITGVQLEKGSTATSFDYRDYGRELIMCQRYYQTFGGVNTTETFGAFVGYNSTSGYDGPAMTLPITMRAVPTVTTIGTFNVSPGTGGTITLGGIYISATPYAFSISTTQASGLTTGLLYMVRTSSTSSRINFTAEL